MKIFSFIRYCQMALQSISTNYICSFPLLLTPPQIAQVWKRDDISPHSFTTWNHESSKFLSILGFKMNLTVTLFFCMSLVSNKVELFLIHTFGGHFGFLFSYMSSYILDFIFFPVGVCVSLVDLLAVWLKAIYLSLFRSSMIFQF